MRSPRLLRSALAAILAAPALCADPTVSTVETAMHATFKLYNEKSTATCFLIEDASAGAVYLVTSAHVLKKAEGESAILVLRKTGENGARQRHDQTIAIRKADENLWTEHPEQDLAAMRLSLPPGTLEDGATLPLESLQAPDLAYGGQVIVLTYPARVESDSAGFPVARQGIVASFPLRPSEKHPVFMIDFTAWAGDSGGPVVLERADGAVIAGIVISRVNHIEKIKTDTEERKIEHPLGLGNALHSSLILDTIRRVLQAAGEAPAAPPP